MITPKEIVVHKPFNDKQIDQIRVIIKEELEKLIPSIEKNIAPLTMGNRRFSKEELSRLFIMQATIPGMGYSILSPLPRKYGFSGYQVPSGTTLYLAAVEGEYTDDTSLSAVFDIGYADNDVGSYANFSPVNQVCLGSVYISESYVSSPIPAYKYVYIHNKHNKEIIVTVAFLKEF